MAGLTEMEIRYLGFEQRDNSRAYQFDVREKGQQTRQLTVTADLEVFRGHSVGIQEGPRLSGNKLAADLAKGWDGEHELTAVDMQAYLDDQSLAEAHRADARKRSHAQDASSARADQELR
jgi:hypothetical protein